MDNSDTLIEKYIGEGNIYELKDMKGKKVETSLSPEKRTLENKPEQVKIQDWLNLKKSPKLYPKLNDTN